MATQNNIIQISDSDAQHCLNMYIHYAERLQDPAVPPDFKEVIKQMQQCYTDAHHKYVPFKHVVKGLPIEMIPIAQLYPLHLN